MSDYVQIARLSSATQLQLAKLETQVRLALETLERADFQGEIADKEVLAQLRQCVPILARLDQLNLELDALL